MSILILRSLYLCFFLGTIRNYDIKTDLFERWDCCRCLEHVRCF